MSMYPKPLRIDRSVYKQPEQQQQQQQQQSFSLELKAIITEIS